MNRYVAEHPSLVAVLRFAYQSFRLQAVFVVVLLSLRMSHRRLAIFMLAWTFALIISLIGHAVAPSETAYVHYGMTAGGSLPDLSAQAGAAPAEVLHALRAGGLRHLLDDDLNGLVTFPSFHAAAALLYVWALWPLAWIRWPAVLLNGLMLVAVPVIGAHYLVDLIAALPVAVLSVAMAKMFAGTRAESAMAGGDGKV